MSLRLPKSTLFPYTTLFRSLADGIGDPAVEVIGISRLRAVAAVAQMDEVFPVSFRPGETGVYDSGKDRKSTRLNSSHPSISYAVFFLNKKNLRFAFVMRDVI